MRFEDVPGMGAARAGARCARETERPRAPASRDECRADINRKLRVLPRWFAHGGVRLDVPEPETVDGVHWA